ncbi:MAG: sulfate transporter CysZ [Haliea sp.]|nr:sulfate transporter CysZ [Haliea sp.]|tara:strand:- start:16724 stop:17458 length:735 start_codon:yes stop_codon:yes gene_type:complete
MSKGNLLHGADYLARGARMLTHPALRTFVVVPLVVNVLIFASLWGLAFNWLGEVVDGWMAAMPEWLGFLEWLLWPLLIALFALITGYLFTAVALLIASPFNSLLAEKAEELTTGQPVAGLEGLGQALLSVPRGMWREVQKLLYYLPMALLVLILTFIPPISALSPVLWFLLGAWMMSLQFIDYPMDNHQLSFARVREAARSRRLSSLGFGGLVAICAGIPVLNFFVVPAAVVGATLLWCEELRP